jgi:hypothetical protein
MTQGYSVANHIEHSGVNQPGVFTRDQRAIQPPVVETPFPCAIKISCPNRYNVKSTLRVRLLMLRTSNPTFQIEKPWFSR